MEEFNEVDQMLSSILESNGVDNGKVPDLDLNFLDNILNEGTTDVSSSGTVDDPTEAAIFSANAPAQQQTTTHNGFVNSTPVSYQLLQNAVCEPVVPQQMVNDGAQPLQVTYALGNQQVILQVPPADNGIPVIMMPVSQPTPSLTPTESATNAESHTTQAYVSSSTSSSSSSIQDEQTPPTRGRSKQKKRKLYEEEAFQDPVLEKKRLNAINAKKHRDEKNVTIKRLQGEKEEAMKKLEDEAKEKAALSKVVEELRRENEKLKQELHERDLLMQQMQQEKFGILDLDPSLF